VKRLSKKLKLNKKQKQELTRITDEILAKVKKFKGSHEEIFNTFLLDENWYFVEGDCYSKRYSDIHKLDIRIDRDFHFNN
jgi:hypothetical protein